jgi:hypothetical protein
MPQYITKIRTESGDLPIDYNALANRPQSDTTLSKSGKFADAKATGDAINDVENTLNSNLEYVNTQLSTKADLEYVNTQLGTKADEVYVDTKLDLKANVADVETKLDTKANALEFAAVEEAVKRIDVEIDSKANTSEVNEKLALKASITYVDSKFDSLAEITSSEIKTLFARHNINPN